MTFLEEFGVLVVVENRAGRRRWSSNSQTASLCFFEFRPLLSSARPALQIRMEQQGRRLPTPFFPLAFTS